MRNADWCAYTLRHREAVRYVTEKYIRDPVLRRKMLERAEIHDMDKVFLYLLMDQKRAQDIHVSTMPHHPECQLPKTREDYVETVLDYESAPYTKPDKPMQAWTFLKKLNEMGLLDRETSVTLENIMLELGLDRDRTEEELLFQREFLKTLPEVTEDMIYDEVVHYLLRLCR